MGPCKTRNLADTCRSLLRLMRCMNKDLHNSLESTECTRPRLGLSWLENDKNVAKKVHEVLLIAAFMAWAGCLTPSSPSPTSSSKAGALLVVCFALGCRGCSSTDSGVRNATGLDRKHNVWGTLCQHRALGWKGDCVCVYLRVSIPSKPPPRHNQGWQHPAGSSAGG